MVFVLPHLLRQDPGNSHRFLPRVFVKQEKSPIMKTPLLVPPGFIDSGTATAGSALSADAHPALLSVAKHLVDVTGAAVGLTMLAPVLLVIAWLVRRESPGPILFRQRRLGLNGETFEILKFRTMAADAESRVEALETRNESAGGVLFKIRDDPRVTPLGRVLRRTSLDELPQLVNVLRGEMSLVGPRPLQLRDSQRLQAIDSGAFDQRLRVLPGVSGPWQVRGRSELDCSAMLQLDLEYIEGWSLGLDLQILCKTVVVVLTGRGAC